MKRASEEDEPRTYTIRMRERARREITAATVRFAEQAGDRVAMDWNRGLLEEIAGLAQFPRRCPIAPERFRTEMRQFIYRRRGSQISHRIFFTIFNEEPNALEPPTIMIFHLRHGAARAMTRREIQEIEGAE